MSSLVTVTLRAPAPVRSHSARGIDLRRRAVQRQRRARRAEGRRRAEAVGRDQRGAFAVDDIGADFARAPVRPPRPRCGRGMMRSALRAAPLQLAAIEATRWPPSAGSTPSPTTFSALAASVEPVVVMSTMRSAAPRPARPRWRRGSRRCGSRRCRARGRSAASGSHIWSRPSASGRARGRKSGPRHRRDRPSSARRSSPRGTATTTSAWPKPSGSTRSRRSAKSGHSPRRGRVR